MAKDQSFDVVSQVDLQEADNAVQQASKELLQRYDLKSTGSTVGLDKHASTITVTAPDDFVMRQVIDVLNTKLIRREIDLKAFLRLPFQTGKPGIERDLILFKAFDAPEEIAEFLVQEVTREALDLHAHVDEKLLRLLFLGEDIHERPAVRFVAFRFFDTVRRRTGGARNVPRKTANGPFSVPRSPPGVFCQVPVGFPDLVKQIKFCPADPRATSELLVHS